MASNRIYITDFWTDEPDVEQEAIGDVGTVIPLGATSVEELLPKIADADALLVWHDIKLTPAVFDAARRCKLVVRIGVGYDNVPIAAATERGIAVCIVPDYGVEEVADHAIAMLLALVRNLPQYQHELRAAPPVWDARHCKRTPRLRDKVFGVVGVGRIGSATALRAKAFGMDVVGFDPYVPDGRGKSLGIRMADSLEELLGQSDFISIHTPLTDETRGLIDPARLERFKRGALLINTARGPICNTAAVLSALENGQLGGVGLDVLPTEPPTGDDPLLAAARDPESVAYHRCVLSPHSAFYTEESFEEMRRKAAKEVRRGLLGQALRNRVN